MKIRTHSVEETKSVAEAFAAVLRPNDLVVLTGELGGGKTAFVQGACVGLGISEQVTSPTYAIVQEYSAATPVQHLDVYRLNSVTELIDLGFTEMIDSGCIMFMEWGERVESALPADHIVVRIGMPDGDDIGDTERIVGIAAHGSHAIARAHEIAISLAHYLHPESVDIVERSPMSTDSH